MSAFDFKQVDVFSPVALKGNALAVVFGADRLSDERMAAFANWTNLSETTFVLEPRDPRADYRVRIFTTLQELPFAGHPTLGTCHAWLEAGGVPKGEEIIQECGVGLVRVRRQGAQQCPYRCSGDSPREEPREPPDSSTGVEEADPD